MSRAARRAHARRWSVALLLLVLAAGCGLPESGQVHYAGHGASQQNADSALFIPPGPGVGDSPAEIARGFLLAMQANPISTSVARSFLVKGAQSTWSPDRGTIVYSAQTADQITTVDRDAVQGSTSVRVRLGGASGLDARGGWMGPLPASADSFTLSLVQEHGQWRISNPPNRLIVPREYFSARFSPYLLYFFDQTERSLVPDRVYLPSGPDPASSLVQALLEGPSRDLAPVTRTEFTPQTQLDLSVLVSNNGTADVPLSKDVLRLSPGNLAKAADQLAATLHQLPGLTRLRVSVDGGAVPLAGGSRSMSLLGTPAFSPSVPGSTTSVYGLLGSSLVEVRGTSTKPVSGPFGSGFALRSVAVSLDGRRATAVAGNGETVYSGPVGGPRGAAVRRVYQGTDVLRPVTDIFGESWLVDRTSHGAVVVLVHGASSQTVRIPGISGQRVLDVLVSRDGTRLVAAVAGPDGSARIRVAGLLRAGDGTFASALSAREVTGSLARLRGLVDLQWADPADLAVLTSRTPGLSVLSTVPIDGSPGDPLAILPDPYRGQVSGLVSSPDESLPTYLVGPRSGLEQLSPAGRWESTQVGGGVRAPAYAGG